MLPEMFVNLLPSRSPTNFPATRLEISPLNIGPLPAEPSAPYSQEAEKSEVENVLTTS